MHRTDSHTLRISWTLWAGLGLIIVMQVLLWMDVQRRGGMVVPLPSGSYLTVPTDTLGRLARWAAVNMTPVCWIGYLLVFDGLLSRWGRDGSPLRQRPRRWALAWLTSVPVWCFFDWVNFYFLDAWRYHGMPEHFTQRVLGYLIAFAAISPGMFLAAQLYQSLGLHKLCTSTRKVNGLFSWGLVVGVPGLLATIAILVEQRMADSASRASPLPWWASALVLGLPGLIALVWRRCPYFTSFAIGLSFTIWAILIRDPVANLTLWVGLIYLLDPINHHLSKGQPVRSSIITDWREGRWGRTLALFLGGATCGFCWEFWNYWALAKWTYHLPFVGEWATYSYFEMPWVGFLGFLPFAVECWVVLVTIDLVIRRCGVRLVEPLPDEQSVM